MTFNGYIQRALEVLDDARMALPPASRAPAPPWGTPERAAYDRRWRRISAWRQREIELAHARVVEILDAAVRVRPHDVELADLRRAWATPVPSPAPGPLYRAWWRVRQDERLEESLEERQQRPV